MNMVPKLVKIWEPKIFC